MSETERLAALAAYEILDSEPEAAFDRVASLAAGMFDAPIAAISFVDGEREWFKSSLGLAETEIPRADGLGDRLVAMTPGDTLTTDGLAAVPGTRFYAGVGLTNAEGWTLGTLCILDDRTRPPLTRAETERLRAMAAIVVDALELRRAVRHAADVQRTLDLLERVVRGDRESAPAPEAEPLRRAG